MKMKVGKKQQQWNRERKLKKKNEGRIRKEGIQTEMKGDNWNKGCREWTKGWREKLRERPTELNRENRCGQKRKCVCVCVCVRACVCACVCAHACMCVYRSAVLTTCSASIDIPGHWSQQLFVQHTLSCTRVHTQVNTHW